jgi:hypothetical protein
MRDVGNRAEPDEGNMKTFVSMTLAFAAIGGIVLVTPVIAQSVDTQEDAASRHRRTPAARPQPPSGP